MQLNRHLDRLSRRAECQASWRGTASSPISLGSSTEDDSEAEHDADFELLLCQRGSRGKRKRADADSEREEGKRNRVTAATGPTKRGATLETKSGRLAPDAAHATAAPNVSELRLAFAAAAAAAAATAAPTAAGLRLGVSATGPTAADAAVPALASAGASAADLLRQRHVEAALQLITEQQQSQQGLQQHIFHQQQQHGQQQQQYHQQQTFHQHHHQQQQQKQQHQQLQQQQQQQLQEQLGKCTVVQLQGYLRCAGLKATGLKIALIDRIKAFYHVPKSTGGVSQRNGGLRVQFPEASFSAVCVGDVCQGDTVMFRQRVFEDGCKGHRTVAGRVVRESYGALKQQHTFTLEVLWSYGMRPKQALDSMLIKGRNLYRVCQGQRVKRRIWPDESLRRIALDEKHARGDEARAVRAARQGGRGRAAKRPKRSRSTFRAVAAGEAPRVASMTGGVRQAAAGRTGGARQPAGKKMGVRRQAAVEAGVRRPAADGTVAQLRAAEGTDVRQRSQAWAAEELEADLHSSGDEFEEGSKTASEDDTSCSSDSVRDSDKSDESDSECDSDVVIISSDDDDEEEIGEEESDREEWNGQGEWASGGRDSERCGERFTLPSGRAPMQARDMNANTVGHQQPAQPCQPPDTRAGGSRAHEQVPDAWAGQGGVRNQGPETKAGCHGARSRGLDALAGSSVWKQTSDARAGGGGQNQSGDPRGGGSSRAQDRAVDVRAGGGAGNQAFDTRAGNQAAWSAQFSGRDYMLGSEEEWARSRLRGGGVGDFGGSGAGVAPPGNADGAYRAGSCLPGGGVGGFGGGGGGGRAGRTVVQAANPYRLGIGFLRGTHQQQEQRPPLYFKPSLSQIQQQEQRWVAVLPGGMPAVAAGFGYGVGARVGAGATVGAGVGARVGVGVGAVAGTSRRNGTSAATAAFPCSCGDAAARACPHRKCCRCCPGKGCQRHKQQ